MILGVELASALGVLFGTPGDELWAEAGLFPKYLNSVFFGVDFEFLLADMVCFIVQLMRNTFYCHLELNYFCLITNFS